MIIAEQISLFLKINHFLNFVVFGFKTVKAFALSYLIDLEVREQYVWPSMITTIGLQVLK